VRLDPFQVLVLKALGTIINLLVCGRDALPNSYAAQIGRLCDEAASSFEAHGWVVVEEKNGGDVHYERR